MKPSVYIHARYGDDPDGSVQYVILDIGARGKIAEMQLRLRDQERGESEIESFRTDIRMILQKKQCEELLAAGEIRLEPDVTIGEVARELRLAVDDPDGISPIDRTRWSTSN